jgi:RNA polymerase sigma-70 factor (ECF subfamily)
MVPPERREGTGPSPSRDVLLVRGALSGRGEAVREFLERMRCVPRMVAAHNAKLGSPLAEEALEDVVQEALVAIWRKLERFDGRAALETWVYPFCAFEFLRRLRAERRLPKGLDQALAGSILEPVAPSEASLLELEPVLEELEALDPDQAAVLRLKHFEDLTFEALAQRLAISPNTAKTRYYAGLQKLRGRLGKRLTGRAARGAEGGVP